MPKDVFCEGQHLDLGCVGELGKGRDSDLVAELDSKVLPSSFVHSNFAIFEVGFVLRLESNANGLSALLAFEHDLVAVHEVQFFHLEFGKFDDRVVIVLRLLHLQLVGGSLLVEDGLRYVLGHFLCF